MKSERRHDLQTNYLANQLGTAVETTKPIAVWVVGGIIGVALAALGYGIYSTFASQASAAAWGEYYFQIDSTDAEAFQKVIDDHPNSQAAAWATQTMADGQLLAGLNLVYSDRKQAEEKIQAAISNYESLAKSTYDLELKDRATIGLAQAYEALGKLDEAGKYYQQVAGSNVLPAVAATAAERLAWIKSDEGKAFYAWFESAKRTPDQPPTIPGDLSVPPTSPDMSFAPMPNLPPTGTVPAAPDAGNAAPLPGSSPAPTSEGGGTVPLPSNPAPSSSPAADAPASAPAAPAPEAPKADAPPAEAPPK